MSEPGAAPEDPIDLEAWRTANELSVPFDEALDRWADAAYTALVETAGRYGAYISFAELAARAQAEVGIATRAPVRTWIAALQRRITDRCQAAGEPPLVALTVGHDQKVGEGYAYAVAAAGLPVPANLDEHAAAARFACYLHYGAAIPAGAGPQLTPKLAEAHRVAEAKAARTRPAKSTGRVVKARTSAPPRVSAGAAAKPAKTSAPAKPEPRQAKLCPNCFTELAATGVCGYC
ncbi:putative protein OS=Tsukamurella paurometabola (strain ATCC 8368 / DSM / CCUG 35730 /CIP 100753 / JCM 10117 / KCTC 9821 / NBRC 16120 / NCIMB 702349/ NCTC 13040) OX=521096 GN=Tpau_4081 PE=4 SV=1 [Tsukamurella paurometabola]|uniref:Uncharacterized protein n=1 Tax=Tsukamurella paurometabola (strain ATCC 8368 / DSM 20162 / CCUG 35730 / CIP 100753 / JCM 10117 / KCTC 9821 / NBRC 16120 / NCIMB 702349 / NCTC 13040) TaxID=521096 RepID=D5UNF6_TSUPD|nr:hypothetical protein [Tsukamurella paurometabola]ADG80651.1 conserved hypothetical protein [Tsukamurella paurometabola DSM 20162]SUP40437.1 Uncharacterised protein [Tsukamurella paurometabola]